MPSQCPACSKINPSDAFYCYYDGRLLSKDGQQGPVHVGSLPFATAFYFPDGQTCVNFNQLALACDSRWNEARGLLAEGIWTTFFKGIGRLDLAAAATQAATEPDPDRGLSLLLEKMPADPDCMRPPKISVESSEENLGQLSPGTDLTFEIIIINQGMLVLRGSASSDCEWLVFGTAPGTNQKIFQTRHSETIKVRVLGSKLRAGLKPLEGEIILDTNGGMISVKVKADVPITPFPVGADGNAALAGAKSPREVALKAKEHPNEAAQLFEQGAVKTWFANNGWTYPIEGSEGSGKGAIQQFYEALGLTKAPKLEINTTSLSLKGKVGDRLSRRVTVSTQEPKPVYAQAWSNQNWVTFGPIKYLGNKVEVPIEITVPPQPDQTVQAQVTIQGNGKQRFVVPVSVAVEEEVITVVKPISTKSPRRERDNEESSTNWLVWVLWFGGSFLVAAFFLLLIVAAILILQRFR